MESGFGSRWQTLRRTAGSRCRKRAERLRARHVPAERFRRVQAEAPVTLQQTIAHYRITAKLGEGGMGEVWRATDTKLNREVAIKLLPEAFAADPDRMARFQREAQVLALLNHPNIAAIYGVEERALVMEFVDGAT